MRGGVVYRYDTGNKTGKKTPGGAGKHTGHTGDTRAHNRYSTGTGTVPVTPFEQARGGALGAGGGRVGYGFAGGGLF